MFKKPEKQGFLTPMPAAFAVPCRDVRIAPMCNLYSITKGQAAIIAFARAMRDLAGNLPPMPGVFPDYPAPIVRNAPDGVRELMLARWGMPGPPQFGGAPITNIRNTASPHWRAWLNVEHRCVVPFNSFCEYADTKPRKTPTWFALDDERPLAFFAGIWTNWHGERGTKANPIAGEHRLFGFLTTDANAEVGAIHPKAMPAILTSTEAVEQADAAGEGSARTATTAPRRRAQDCRDG
jgi:putative SOS response-associated peptidase YedK